MKSGTRLYINITNSCNTNCPFCCMYSGTNKKTKMSFKTFKSIIDDCEGQFELQLEGGEPFLNEEIYLFIEYAVSTKRCKKIIILSNGILMDKHIKRIVQIANWYCILIELKISINYWLISQIEGFMENMDRLLFATIDMNYINVIFNVRKRKEDTKIEELIDKYNLREHSNIFFFQSYGKMTDSDYDKPVIVQNIDNWRLYASDGKCFKQDLIARSEYEKELD